MASSSQPRNWHSFNLEMVTTNLPLPSSLRRKYRTVQHTCKERFDKSKSDIAPQGRKSSTWQKHEFSASTWVLPTSPMQRQALPQGIEEPPGHREEGKLRGESEGYTGQRTGHGLLNSFSLGGKKKDILCTRSLFLKQTLVVLIYTTACS